MRTSCGGSTADDQAATDATGAEPLFTIRSYEERDRASLIDLWERSDLTRPWNDPDRDIDRKLSVADDLLLIAEADRTVVGSVMAGYDGHRGWINYLAVDPAQRRNGLGRELMLKAEQLLAARGCPKVNLQVRSANAAVIDFYAAIGYRHDDVVSMGKRLQADEAD